MNDQGTAAATKRLDEGEQSEEFRFLLLKQEVDFHFKVVITPADKGGERLGQLWTKLKILQHKMTTLL